MAKSNSENSERTVYKKAEFDIFLQMLKKASVNPVLLGTWSSIATDLGVDNDTITAWKKMPQARDLIIKAKIFALEQMQQAGIDDWRMWKEQAKMLDVDFKDNKMDVTSKGEKIESLVIIKDGSKTE